MQEEICLEGKFICKLSKKIKSDLWGINLIAASDASKIDKNNIRKNDKDKNNPFLVKVSGTDLPVITGISVRYYGYNGKGYFCVSRYEYEIPSEKNTMVKFLSSKAFPGVGKATAQKLIDSFGTEIFKLLGSEEGRKEISKLIGESKAIKMASSYKKVEGISSLQIELSKYGVPSNIISRVWDRFGEDSINLLKANPYKLMEADGFGFAYADKIARTIGIKNSDSRRVCATLAHVIESLGVLNSGDVWIEKSEALNRTSQLLGFGDNVIAEKGLKILCDKNRYVVRANRCIYPIRYESAEYNTCQKALHLLSFKPDDKLKGLIESEVSSYNRRNETTLSNNQLEAVKKSLLNKFSIITGGPGTGKTTIIKAIISIFEKVCTNGEEVTLLSPTGKAAQRMSEVCGKQARTIHSKLGIFKDADEALCELEPGLIIVDESSMLDQSVAEKLFDAVPSGSYLILVGDVNQLPSVGAGSVLKDFIDSGIVPTSILNETFRQKNGSLIIDNAKKVNSGDASLTYDDDSYIYESVSGEDEALDKIVKLYLDESKIMGEDSVAVLCPRRRMTANGFKVTTEYLNETIQDYVNPLKKGDPVFEQSVDSRTVQYRIGSRVMQTRNNANSSNGDIGIIMAISDEGIEIAWNNGNTVMQSVEDMETVTLGYCLTVHRSQGSEYQTVIIPMLSDQKGPLFKRNLLYTAITRAKRKVIMVCDEPCDKKNSLTNYCITHTDIGQRRTLLKRRLEINAPKYLGETRTCCAKV